MAGMTKLSLWLFPILDCLGTLIWVLVFAGVGFWFHDELELLATRFADLGAIAGYILFTVLVLYIGGKFAQRRIFLRSLRMRRLEPGEVNELLTTGENVHVIDLRHNYDFDLQPEIVPTAIRIPMEAIERHVDRIQKNSDIIVYCS